MCFSKEDNDMCLNVCPHRAAKKNVIFPFNVAMCACDSHVTDVNHMSSDVEAFDLV
jgi:hypothetical protein